MKKKLIAIMIAAILLTMLPATVIMAESEAARAVVQIGNNISSYKSDLQKNNARLLAMSPDEIAAADFAVYDTSNTLAENNLYKSDAEGQGFGGSIDMFVKGKTDKINTLGAGTYFVHSIEGGNGYPELFSDNTILRAERDERVQLSEDFTEGTLDYQIIKNKKNVYIENIDFYGFNTLKFEYCDNIIINNCSFNYFTMNGLVFRGCKNVYIINSEFVECGCEMADETNSGYSIRFVGDEVNPSENILIENCHIENSCGKAISFVGSVDDYVIRNNEIFNSVWGAIDYWTPSVSGKYVNVIENNKCVNTGFGKPSKNDKKAISSGVGCAVIFAGMGTSMPKTIVKNNVIDNAVETGIEGPYELVYHNTVKNTGENSAARYTGSTEAVYIKLVTEFEQKYINNTIETRGLRCFSSYSAEDKEYKGVYIINNNLLLKPTDNSITCNYKRSDIEINCPKLAKLVIKNNKGMQMESDSVNIYMNDRSYTMQTLEISNPCKIGYVPNNVQNKTLNTN